MLNRLLNLKVLLKVTHDTFIHVPRAAMLSKEYAQYPQSFDG